MGTIDLTPTWTAVMPALCCTLENGTPEGKKLAREELMDLAKKVDEMNAKSKEQPKGHPAWREIK